MAALPYMQLYVAEYLADTMHLTTEEHGAYLLLIFNYWQTGKPIPKARLARIARLTNDRWQSVEVSLREFFSDTGSEWVHSRIEADLAMVSDAQAQRAAAGKASAEARKRAKHAEKKREINDRSTTVQRSKERNSNENSTNKEQNRTEQINKTTMSSTLDFAVKDSPEIEALKYLNIKTGREYKPVESNLKLIRARIKEGATIDDLMSVVDLKVSQWADNPKMREYLRPATLFNAEKFNQYVAQAKDPGFKDGVDEWLAEMGASDGNSIDGDFFEVKNG